MKISHPVVVAAATFQATQLHVSEALDVMRIFGFQENNYVQSPNQKFISTSTSLAHSDTSIAQRSVGGKGEGDGAKRGKGDQAEGSEDDECCTCTCFDHVDEYGKYDRIYRDGDDYCHCSCSCESKVSMPIIPTVPPPPVEPSPSPLEPTPSPLVPTPPPVMVTPTPSPVVPTAIPTDSPMVAPTVLPTESPTDSPTASPTPSPTAAPTLPPLKECEFPQPPVLDEFDNIVNVTECPADQVTFFALNNSLIQLQKDIECSDFSLKNFLRVVGDNNTVDCNGHTVADPAGRFDAFSFKGKNNILRNCPNISDFNNDAISVDEASSLYVFNVTAMGNGRGISMEQAEVFVNGCNFSGNRGGISVAGSNSSATNLPFMIVVVNSIISDTTNESNEAISLLGFGVACLEGNDFSNNPRNVVIDEVSFGKPIVTMARNNACNSTSGVDIFDDTEVGTTTVINTTCSSVSGTVLDAAEYGCEPCPP